MVKDKKYKGKKMSYNDFKAKWQLDWNKSLRGKMWNKTYDKLRKMVEKSVSNIKDPEAKKSAINRILRNIDMERINYDWENATF